MIFEINRKALFERLMMALMRMHDTGKPERACLEQAITYLRDSDVRNSLTTKLRISKDGIDGIFKKWPELKRTTRDSRKLLTNYRDQKIAHNINFAPSKKMPLYHDLFDLLDETIFFIELLSSVLSLTAVSFDSVKTVWEKRADIYWKSVLLNGNDLIE